MPQIDLVRDSKLETEFRDDCTIHTFIEPSGRNRRISWTEYWRFEKQNIGRGGFGQVQLERCVNGKRKDMIRAVKIINKPSGSTKKKPMEFERELEAIAKFSQKRYNSWFIESFGWYEDTTSIFITMEYCPYGDLRHYLSKQGSITSTEAQHLTYQMLEGLHHMHENDFAHRDLKPGNILVKSRPPGEKWWIVLADFGISKRADEGNGPPTTIKGTEGFMAPELVGFGNRCLKDITGFKAADMWALGEIAFQMLTGKPTFSSQCELFEYCKGEQKFPSDRLPSSTGDEGRGFISRLMAVYPNDRMSTSQCFDHGWMVSQGMNIEDELVGLDMSQTNEPLTIQPDITQGASASWRTISSNAESKFRQTIRRRPVKSSGSYQEMLNQSQVEERYKDSSLLQNPKKRFDAQTTLQGHGDAVSALAFSPDGKTLASASYDHTVRLWDGRSGAPLQTLRGHEGLVDALAFSPDGKTLAPASCDHTVRLWDGRSGAPLQTLRGHGGAVDALAFSPDGKTLASASYDHTVRLWT